MVPAPSPSDGGLAKNVEIYEMQTVQMQRVAMIQHMLLLHVFKRSDELVDEAPADVDPQAFYSDIVNGLVTDK